MSVQNADHCCFQKAHCYREKYLLEFLILKNSLCPAKNMIKVEQVARELLALDDRRSPESRPKVASFIAVLRCFSKIDNPDVTLGSCFLLTRVCKRIGNALPPKHSDLKECLDERIGSFLEENNHKKAVKPFIEQMRNHKENDPDKMNLIIKCLEEILIRIEIDPDFSFEEELCECLSALMDLKMSLTAAGVDLVRWALKNVNDPSPFRKLLGAS